MSEKWDPRGTPAELPHASPVNEAVNFVGEHVCTDVFTKKLPVGLFKWLANFCRGKPFFKQFPYTADDSASQSGFWCDLLGA